MIIVANHLSYADANVVRVLRTWRRRGAGGAADGGGGTEGVHESAAAFFSLCFGTIKVPQSGVAWGRRC